MSGSETQSLISSPSYSRSVILRLACSGRHLLPGPGYKWLLSKPVLTVIFINFIVSVSYAVVMAAAQESVKAFSNIYIMIISISLLMALVSTIFSPLSGFLADVHFGRYRVLSASICLVLAACFIVSLIAVIRLLVTVGVLKMKFYVHHVQPVMFGFGAVALLLFLPSIASYQANFIPFGLYQLLEAPSVSLALFIHWIIWADRLGNFVVRIVVAVYECIEQWTDEIYVLPFASLLLVTVCFILIVVCLRKCQFNVEAQRHNPYKMIYKVLVYTRKHSYPLQRSAFTYSDDEVPSRLDYAKERFGGPFTTEQVEDVKTFFNILLVLLALGPVFVLEIPASFFITTMFAVHLEDSPSAYVNHSCSARFILLEKGAVTSLIALILLPLFIWIVFSLLQQRVLSIFSRLHFAALIYLLGVASMFCIDLAGHIISESNSPDNISMCMFIYHRYEHPVLKLHWAVMLVPSLFLGLGPPLAMATTFEFISAQSPSSMKGLLVGVFFSIRAFFQLVSGVALIPFAYKRLWDSKHMREHPPVTNCGFGYLLFTCVVALIGFILLSVVARRYKYRERDDKPFDHRFAIAVIGRDIEERCNLEENY